MNALFRLLCLALMLVGVGALGQSNLPPCQGSDKSQWSNCYGKAHFAFGNSYEGEFKDGKLNGRGTFFSWSGAILNQGLWADDKFVRPLDIKQSVVPLNDELAKLRAEAEALKRKQFEAEERQAIKDREAEQRQKELEAQLRQAQQQTQQVLPATIRPTLNARNDRRVALVIGNATYKNSPLRNPVNDSNDMAQSLRAVGFDVVQINNSTLAQMREATRRFADKLASSDVGLVYYSGHGLEVKGKNYLVPVNADIAREYEVADQAFDASQFLEMMESIRGPNAQRVNILIVDACRNNDLPRSWRSTSSGLARMDAPGGTFISFATAPGKVAADGQGRNSPYTKHLLQAMKQPNVPIEQAFKLVRRNVMDETKGEQVPWDNSSLVGDFYFTVQR